MAVAEQLNVQVRESRGKQAAKQMRRAGKVPGVVYASGEDPIPVEVETRAMNTVIRHHGQSALVELEGLPGGKTLAVYKELQTHPVTWAPIHVDFHRVRPGEKCTVEVKVELKGLPVGVDRQGGVLVRAHDMVKIACLPEDVPEIIVADVKGLHIGEALHLADVGLDPEKFTLVSPGNTTLASVAATREALSKKGAADAEAKPEEGAAKPGAKPAAKAAAKPKA